MKIKLTTNKQKKHLNFFLWFCFYALLFFILLEHSFTYLDNDFGWHIQTGKSIFIEHQVPHQQIYDWTLENKTWVDHEWLSNLFLYLGYNYFGYLVLNIFFALIIIFTLAIATFYVQKKIKHSATYFLMFLQLIGVLAMLPHLGVRLQEITILLLSVLLILINNFYHQPSKQIYLTIPLFILWVNLHGGFLIGLAVFGWWLSTQIILRIYQSWQKKKEINQQIISWPWLKHYIFALILSLLATLLNPYGWKLYQFLEDYTNRAYLYLIAEWKAIYVFPFQYWQIFFIALTLSFLIIYFSFLRAKKKLNFWQFSLIIIFLILSIQSVRNFPLFFIVVYFNLIPIIAMNNSLWLKKILYHPATKLLLIFVFILLSALVIINTNYNDNPAQNYCHTYPCKAIKFLKQHPQYLSQKLFNNYGYGGFLIWQIPELRLFADGRFPQYPFAGRTLIEEYHDFSNPKKIAKKLKEYKIKLVLWPKKQTNYRLCWLDRLLGIRKKDLVTTSTIRDYLQKDKHWKIIFQDKTSIIYNYEN